VWGSGPLIFQKSSFIGFSFQQLLSFFPNRLGRDDLNLMAILSQCKWFRRNKLVFDDVLLHPSTVVQKAKMGLEVFLKSYASHLNKEVEPSPPMFTRRWLPPHPGTIKINWDASINKSTGCVGWGIVARDHCGSVLGAKSAYNKISVEPVIDEAMAALEACLFCKEVGFFDIILEGDALQIVLEINSGSLSLSCFGHFIDSINRELSSFRSAKFVHVPRELNSTVRVLAKEASFHCLDHVWLEETLYSISDVVLREHVSL